MDKQKNMLKNRDRQIDRKKWKNGQIGRGRQIDNEQRQKNSQIKRDRQIQIIM